MLEELGNCLPNFASIRACDIVEIKQHISSEANYFP